MAGLAFVGGGGGDGPGEAQHAPQGEAAITADTPLLGGGDLAGLVAVVVVFTDRGGFALGIDERGGGCRAAEGGDGADAGPDHQGAAEQGQASPGGRTPGLGGGRDSHHFRDRSRWWCVL